MPADAGPDDLRYESDFLNLIIRDGALGQKVEFPQRPRPPDSVPHNPSFEVPRWIVVWRGRGRAEAFAKRGEGAPRSECDVGCSDRWEGVAEIAQLVRGG